MKMCQRHLGLRRLDAAFLMNNTDGEDQGYGSTALH